MSLPGFGLGFQLGLVGSASRRGRRWTRIEPVKVKRQKKGKTVIKRKRRLRYLLNSD